MKKISNYSIRTAIGLIVTVVLILNLGQGITKGIQMVEKNERDLSLSSLIPHDPIYITSDGNFTDYGFLGLGTEEDPYLIDGYNITTTDFKGIYINGTTKYFIVRNCYVDAKYNGVYIINIAGGTATVINNTCNNNIYEGIYLYGSDNSTVANNTCNNGGSGIALYYSGSSTVANNTCNNGGSGIYLSSSGSSTVANNTCSNNYYDGIKLSSSGNSTVANNTCSYNEQHGIILDDSGNSIVSNNTCNNNWVGIYLSSSGSSTVANNTCSNNDYGGIYLYSSSNSTVANNTCSDNRGGILDRGIALYYSGSSTVANNTCNNNSYDGTSLLFSDNSTVANNTCNNNYVGISLSSSGNSTVANNTCRNNDEYGISLSSSGSSTVANNTLTNCGLDIYESKVGAYLSYTIENNWVNGKKLGFYTSLNSTTIAEPIYGQLILVNCIDVTVRDQILNNASTGLFLYYCTYSVIINNTCNNNSWDGIYLSSSGNSTVANNTCNNGGSGIALYYSSNSTVVYNTCNNGGPGISLSSSGSSTLINNTCNNNSWDGIGLGSSGSSTLTNNTCNNNYRGINFYYSDLCVITYNLLQENEKYGVYLDSNSDNNVIHHNTFVDNNHEGNSQAYDAGRDNSWYLKRKGNYWSDWSGTGDYSVDGYAGSEDKYPLDEPAEYSTDENPLNFTFTLLMLVIPLILIRIISEKLKK